MTLRDYFAGQAARGMVERQDIRTGMQKTALITPMSSPTFMLKDAATE